MPKYQIEAKLNLLHTHVLQSQPIAGYANLHELPANSFKNVQNILQITENLNTKESIEVRYI